eukprot:GCRY01002493.1.p1 GENE.GCRY01002493.1~~GCRY01002493.1.p1  ORF type:complete len:351 (-),score=19.20 GCRY01002493.1:383-1435(-)
MEILTTFGLTVSAVLQVFCSALGGAIVVRSNIISQNELKSINQILFHILLPALTFTKSLNSISIQTLFSGLWILSVSSILSIMIGFCIGLILKFLFKVHYFSKVFVIACAFGNCGYFPLSLVPSLLDPFEDNYSSMYDDDVEEAAIARVVGYMSMISIVFWTLGFSFLRSDSKQASMQRTTWSQILNPPVLAFLLAVTLGSIPGLKSLIQDTFVFDTLSTLGTASVPLALCVLGGNLAAQPSVKLNHKQITLLTILGKFFVLPLFHLGIVFLLGKSGFDLLPDDPLMKFVILLNGTVPVAVNVMTASQLLGLGREVTSRLLFFNYSIAMLMIPIWVTLFILLTSTTVPLI